MAVDGGNQAVFHLNEDEHPRLNQFINQLEAQRERTDILLERALELLLQGEYKEVCIFMYRLFILKLFT